MKKKTEIWYKFWFDEISQIEVVSSTPAFVTTNEGRREKRVTDWYGIFPTYAEAKQFAIGRAQRLYEAAKTKADSDWGFLQLMKDL